ncbi:RagB/SusD family nutrient uptake outer membrane protein [Membranicola marinus]|uniref:RagB/SusD family nutrient uptake outer membrane protein n=1 Tax=Membranihabitans marinus TaxID=1227546 RepID=A0A953L9L5_9BACT|nr:RagB/SusD family nutrient uptake outer membrane protein [Membranihabitans marinus]MBY5956771.1 RagB/SusD family nutrient uptake outer membrane protein [Membranihabitans marinus]
MRYIHITLSSILLFLTLVSCDEDFLDRPPKDNVDADFFFNTPKDLEVATNDFYTMLPTKSVYTDDAASDNIIPLIASERIRGGRIVPTRRGSGGWSWGNLRDINFFLEHYQKVEDEEAKKTYGGVARFFRALFYFNKVKRFGDVPWYNHVLSADDEDLYKSRDSRQLIMDSVMMDIDYAIANMTDEKELNLVTKYTALLLKSRIGLFEGTFRKYHGLPNHEKMLQHAVDAAEELIESGAYQLYTAGGPDEAYRNLFSRDNQDAVETILAADYEKGIRTHNLGYLMTAPTQGAYGINKDLINSYLMKDGSRFTDIDGYETIEYYEEMQNRDPRLTQTTAGPGFTVNGESEPEPVKLEGATTGYRVIKALPSKDQWSSAHFDIIVYRYAEALLNLAEAKAELGTITQADLDKTINLLRDRVGMPHLNLTEANGNPDPYLANMYPNVEQGAYQGVILEIRRERRIELFNEGLRWDDLMRWKEGSKIEKPMVGIYFSDLGAHDFNKDGSPDVYLHDGNPSGAPSSATSIINVQQRILRDPITGNSPTNSGNLNPFPLGGSFDESKDYFYPIPIEELKLNPQLEQNPNWN